MECDFAAVGSYTVEIHLANRRSYVAATVTAEVDVRIADLDIAWAHTPFGSSTCVDTTASAGTRITVFWILDNTNALENYAENHGDLQRLCHDYASEGYYDTEIRVCNSISCTFKNLLIAVVKPLVDVAATAPAFKNNSDPVDFERTTTSGSFMTCECTFGDGAIQILYQETITSPYTFTHTYPRPDCYSWSVMCTNYLNTKTFDGDICIQDSIENLKATAVTPKTFGGDWRVDFNMTKGTNVTCTMTIKDSGNVVQNIPEASIFYEFGANAGYGLIGDDLYNAGDFDIKVSCSNLVHISEVTISVTCDKAIDGTNLSSDLRYAAVGQTVTFDLSTTTGSRYGYSIDFGDGINKDVPRGNEPISPLSVIVTHPYGGPDYYVVTLLVFNLVGNETVTLEVGVEYPIDNGFSISDPNNVVYNTDAVDLVLSWDLSTIEPSSVELVWDFAHDNLIVNEALKLDSSKHKHSRVFPYYTFYNVKVHIANNISTQDLNAIVRVGVPIEDLSIVFPDSVEYNVNATPPVGSVFDEQYAISQMNLSISKGSNVVFVVFCGDGQSFKVERTNSLWDQQNWQEVTCMYPTPGDYQVTVHAINNLTETNLTASTPILVNVEHPIPSPTLVLTPIPPQDINGTAPTCYTLTKDSREYAPTDAKCTIQYADGDDDQVDMTMTGDVFQKCHKDRVLPGNYTIHITCANKVNSYSQSVEIMFQRHIIGLSMIATNYTVEQNTDATVVIEVEDGSHMIIEVFYGDEHSNTLTEYHGDSSNNYMPLLNTNNRFYHNHTYLEGNYTANVTASNSVSNMTVYLSDKFIIQYKMEDLEMVTVPPINMSGAVADGKLCVAVQQPPTDAFCTYYDLPFDALDSRTYYAGTLRNQTERKFCFTYSFPYASIGPRRIDCKCGNKINYIFRTMDVQVVECIKNVTLMTEKTFSIFNCYYNVSQNLTFTLRAQNGSDFNYTFDTRDEQTYKRFTDQDLQYRRVPFTRDFYYSYSLPGSYKPDVKVENVVCSTTVTNTCGSIIIQYPIPEVECTLESDIIQYPFEEMRLTVTKDDSEEWTDPSVMASIGDFNVTNTGTRVNFMLPNDDGSLFGEHHLTCTVFNNVSTQIKFVPFIMQEYIGVLKFTPNNTYLTVGKEFTLTMNLTHGTHVKYKLNYNTDHDQVEHYNHTYPLNSTLNYSVNHTYVQEGNFTVNITAYNLVNMTSKLAYFPVMAKIHPNMSLNVESKIISSPPGIVKYSLCYPANDVQYVKAQYVTMLWNIGDDSQPEVIYTEDFKHSTDHCFRKEVPLVNFPSGNLKTCVNLTNAVSAVSTCVDAKVYQVITEPEAFLHDKIVVATDENFNVTCKAGKGSNVTVFADFGDGNTSAKVFLPGYQEMLAVNFTHKYNQNGTFNIVCNFTNVINNTDSSSSLDVEGPILGPENINVTFLPAIANPPGTFAWTIDLVQWHKPVVNFSVSVNGTQGSLVQITSWPHTIMQHFTEAVTGDHNFTLQFNNRVSQQEKVETVHFEERLDNLTLECPPNNTMNTNQTGVLTGEAVIFTCRKQTGSHSTLHVDFGDDNETKSLSWDEIDEDAIGFNHTFQGDGDYFVNVEVDNMLGAVNVSCMVSAYDPVLNVTLVATPESIIVNESIQFSIQVPDGIIPPSRANLSFYINDSIPILVRDFPGSGVLIDRTFPMVGDYQAVATVWNGYNSLVLTKMVRVAQSCRTLHNFNFTKLIQVNKTAHFNATLNGPVNVLCLKYIFTPEAGPSQIIWRGSESLCSKDANFDMNKYENITEGITEVTQTAMFPDKTTLNITLTLTTLCHETITEYVANVTTIPCLTLDFIEDVTNEDGSVNTRPYLFKKKDDKFFHDKFFKLPPDCLQFLPQMTCKVFRNVSNEAVEQPDIKAKHQEINNQYVVEGSAFEYGDYYIRCKAEIPNTPNKNSTRFFFFRIQESQLRVTINNEQLMVAKGFSDTTALTATLLDPDEEDGTPVYKWYCWREGDELTLDEILGTTPAETPIPVPESAGDVDSTEGCFNGKSGLLVGDTSTLALHANTQAKTKYVIRVIATLGTRMASDDVKLEIRENPQMDVKVDIKSFVSGQTQLVPGENATICAACRECPADIKYNWKVKYGGVADSPDKLQNLLKNNYEEKGECIVLLPDKVTPYQQYSFECAVAEAEAKDGESLGEGSTKTCSADVPAHGQLVVTPAEGVALDTQFFFSTPGWTVRNGEGCEFESPSSVALKYTYYKKMEEDGEVQALTIAGGKVVLPPGTNNDKVFISVKVESTITGAFSMADTTVKVKPPEDLSSAIDNIQVEGNGAAIVMVETLGSMVTIPGSSPGNLPGSGGDEDTSISDAVLAAEARQREKMLNVMVNLVVGVMSSDPDPATFLAISQAASASGMLPLSAMTEMVNHLDQVDDPATAVSIATNIVGGLGAGTSSDEVAEVPVVDLDGIPPNDTALELAEQQEAADIQKRRDEANTILASTTSVFLAVGVGMGDDETIVVGTEQLQITFAVAPTNASKQFDTAGGSVVVPVLNISVSVVMNIVYSSNNWYSFGKSAKSVSTGITIFDLKASDGSKVPYPKDLQEPLDIGMKLDEGKDNYLNMDNRTVDPKTLLFFSWFAIDEVGAGALVLDFQLGATYTGVIVCLDIYFKFNITEKGVNQPTPTNFDFHVTLPHSQACNHTGGARRRKRDVSPETDWVVVVPEHLIGPPGLSMGVATRVGEDPKPVNSTPSDMKIRNAITRCRSWNNLDEEWTTEACVVGEGTTLYSTKCMCGKLTEDVKTFSGGITLPTVNTIDFANIFANFLSLLNANPTVMATLICIFCAYLVLLVWARRKDRLDIERWGVTPLVDNMPDNTYFFKMSVYTGLRQRAGTKSKICFILAGDSGDTGVRVLDDGRGKFFDRGALRHFVLSTNMPLGPLNFLRIWHDNSGEGAWASWFLDKIILEDLQAKTRYMFLCGRWMAVDEDDGQVDRSLPVAGEEEIDGFEHLFFSTARRNLTDEHLWLSVLSRPTKSHFSRAQRLTCCVTLLFTTMLASAMFYRGAPDQDDAGADQVIRLGPIILSVQTLIISIYANLLVVPINIIIVTFFRKSKPRHYIDMEEAEQRALKEEMNRQRYAKEATFMVVKEKEEKKDDDEKKKDEADKDAEEKDGDKDKKKKKKKSKKWPKYPLPWWCSVIAWVLAVLSCMVSAFFVLFYSLEWGKLVSEEWLSSLLFSFVQSVIVIQPLKVIAVAMLVSLIFKKYTGEEEDEEDELNKAKLADDEELVTAPDVDLNTLSAPAAPTAAVLAEARAKAAKEKQMWATVKEVVMYLIFLLLVAFIAWGPRDGNMFDMTDNIRGYMGGSDKLNAPNNNETIGFLGDSFRFWLWVNTTVVDMLFNTVHYNEDPTTRRDRAFMRDQVSYRVGQVRLRQLRIPPAQCEVTDVMRHIIMECNIGYSIYSEEDRNYTAGWFLETANTTEPPPGSIELAFKYHSMLELNGFPLLGQLGTYGGGGYVADLSTSPRRARKALAALMDNNWIDYYTRAVIVEYTLYNPNVNLFVHTSYIIEFPATGSTIPTPKISVFQVYSGVGGMGTAVLVAQIIYIFVMLYYMVRAVKTIRKIGSKEYFAEPWNIYEVVVIISSIVCIAMFGMKEAIGRLVTKELSEHSTYGSYLQLATYIELVDYTVGFIVFMANIKFLRLLRFNSHVRQLAQTFRLAGRDLLYFGASFFLVFGAFSMSAGSLFGSHLYDFNDLLHTIQALYGIILGKINLVDMGNVHPILGPAFFLTFLGMVYFVLVNMFVSILTSAYTMVRLGEMQDKDDDEAVVSLFVQRVKHGLGLEKTQRDTGSGYVEPADLLDRRLDVINTWINEYYKEEAMAKKAAMGKVPISKTALKTDPVAKKPNWTPANFNF